jgi:hypothetical protein
MNWKGRRKKRSWLNLRHCSSSCLDGLRKATGKVSQDGRSPDIRLNLGSLEYKCGAIYPPRQSTKSRLGRENRLILAIERELWETYLDLTGSLSSLVAGFYIRSVNTFKFCYQRSSQSVSAFIVSFFFPPENRVCLSEWFSMIKQIKMNQRVELNHSCSPNTVSCVRNARVDCFIFFR